MEEVREKGLGNVVLEAVPLADYTWLENKVWIKPVQGTLFSFALPSWKRVFRK
jgi:hypothetical protein